MRRFVSSVVCVSMLLSSLPVNVWARKLPPADFGQMYSVAARGDLGALLAASERGLDLDAPNSSGDSGICVAIKHGDIMAYNTFIKAGASVHPMCVNYLDRRRYESFLAMPNVVKYSDYPTSFVPRENYDYYIVGAVGALVAGIAWVVMNATSQ